MYVYKYTCIYLYIERERGRERGRERERERGRERETERERERAKKPLRMLPEGVLQNAPLARGALPTRRTTHLPSKVCLPRAIGVHPLRGTNLAT